MIHKVLTIAGSDSGGGAGIQADLKTFEEFNTFGLSAITTILSVDSQTNQHHLFPLPNEVLLEQLDTAFSGGNLAGIKTGLLGEAGKIKLIANYLKIRKQENIVVDPVMAVKSTEDLLQADTTLSLIEHLLPLATVITPNLVEASILATMSPIKTLEEMKQAAKVIHSLGPQNVVIKGGNRLPGDKAIDLLFDGTNYVVFEENKLESQTNHGAGCTFSAAITANIGKGKNISDSVALAKKFVNAAIKHGLFTNEKTGYVWHGAYRMLQNEKEKLHEK